MLIIFRKSQLPLFDMPVQVAGSVRKDGTYVKPHMRIARVALKPHEQGHLFGAPPETPKKQKAVKLEKFLAKHGGAARMKSTLMEMRPEQRAKLIDAMAHLDGLEVRDVMQILGMHDDVDLKPSAEAKPAESTHVTHEQLREAAQRAEPQAAAAENVVSEEAPAEAAQHEIIEHTTGKGKVLRGIVRTDITGHQAKEIDPYTFRKNGGWFIREKHLEQAAAVEGAAPQYVPGEEEKRAENASAVDRSKEQAAKLRAGGEKLKADAEADLGRDRLANTARRARMAAGAESEARKRLAIAGTMINLADAIENGEAQHLKGVSTRAAVETLDSAVRSAMAETDRNLPYVDRQRMEGRAPTPDDIRNAKIYRPSWGNGGADKSRLIEQLKGKRGAKQLIDRMRMSNGPDAEMVSQLKKYLTDKDISYGLGWWNVEQIKRVARLEKLGISDDHQLRLALAEYLTFRDGVKKADPVKQAERALVGQKVGIDFFPTPKSLATRMAEMAGVKPGMSVLEPSAGNGNLADAARDAGATVDTVEISSTLRDILTAKGHNVASHDFESFEPGKQYDAVIMNPPFSDRKDAAHIMRAYDMLKPGGKLVAIAGEGVFFGSDQKAHAFRDWLEEHGAEVEKLPENTFKDKDLAATTGANARLLVVEKPADAAAAPVEQGPQEGDTKTENGVEYVLHEGRWHRAHEAENQTPGTNVKWSTLREWMDAWNQIDRRAASSQRHAQLKAHVAELASKMDVINGEQDTDTLAAVKRLIEEPGNNILPPRGQREGHPATEILQRVGTVLNERKREQAAPVAVSTNPDPVVEDAEDLEDLRDAVQSNAHEKLKEIARRMGERQITRDEPVADDEDNPSSDAYRYADTGYIAGSRKEEAAASVIQKAKKEGARVYASALDFEQLEQNPREAKELITKSNLFGTVDWQALRDGGMEPGAGFLVDRIYAAIGQEPSADTPQARQDYVTGLQTLRDRLEACKTPADVTGVLDALREEYDGVIMNADESARYQELRAQASALSDEEREIRAVIDAAYRKHQAATTAVYQAQHEIGNRKRRGWAAKPELETQLAEAQAAADSTNAAWGEAVANPRKDAVHAERMAIYAKIDAVQLAAKVRNQIENPMHRAWKLMGDRFIGVIRYRHHKGSDAFRNHVATAKVGKIDWSWMEKETARAPRVSKESARFQLKVADSFDRIGGRVVAPQSTAELKSMFGLRDVQSGNWVLRDVASAKFHTEQSAAAFADLADLLGADDAHVALNGRLALAFGARGNGAKGWADGAARAHYETVHRVINLTKMGGGGALAHEWFHALDNMAGEAETGTAAGVHDFASENPDLLPAGELREAMRGLREAMLEGEHQVTQTEAYTAQDVRLANRNIGGQYAGNVARRIASSSDVHAAVQAIDEMLGPKPGTKPTPRQKRLHADWRRIAIAHFGGNPEGGEIEVRSGPRMSSYALEAHKLDQGGKGYWRETHEMAARAFQSWVEDRLSDQGRRNDYLSCLADNRYHVDPLTGMQWKPYPEGEERQRINAAFDRLIAAMQASRTLAKASAIA
ncbi:LPD1 domain-containing protein [Paraburkholderia phenoliruptrix]|uniref:LPD1 domain-containing protein n=1 Tax=Paraburkholderia phenoliruptrix TaxID=252970 RepID=UPI0034D008D2